MVPEDVCRKICGVMLRTEHMFIIFADNFEASYKNAEPSILCSLVYCTMISLDLN
jgi:hypothetical protein